MKITSLTALLLTALIFFSCKNENSYSQLQKREEQTIQTYIQQNKIEVTTSFPETWGANTYYLSPSGLYIRIIQAGDAAVHISDISKSRVGVRTLEYALDANKTVVSDKRAPRDYPYPTMLTYGDIYSGTAIGLGIYEAIGYMKNRGSKAILIVPSELNTDTYKNSLTPRGYEIEITVIE